MTSQMNTQGYPATPPIPMGACGRGCCEEWYPLDCCRPNDPLRNNIDQFNVCPMKVSTLSFLMCDDPNLNETNWETPTELRNILRNHFDGLWLTEAERVDLYNLMREGGFGGQEDSDSDSDSDEEEEEEEVLTHCGRGCCNTWDVRCCCEPNCPQKNSMAQFNVCPQKLETLAWICGNEYGLSNYRDCTYRELGHLVMNFYDGLELTLDPHSGEASELWDLIHEDDSDSDSDSDEDEEEEKEEPSQPDTRPIINQEWIEQNPERWKELNEKPDHCPVCFESEDVNWDGCLAYCLETDDIVSQPTKCTHWFCHDCFDHIQDMGDDNKRRCPICKDPW